MTWQMEDIYRERRAQGQELRERRLAEIHECIPQTVALDEELRTLGISLTTLTLTGSMMAVTKTKQRLEELATQRDQLLREKGYPADYTNLQYFCPKCKDTGRVEGAGACTCYRELLTKRDLERSNMANMLERENFLTFDASKFSEEPDPIYRRSPRENIMHVKAWAQNFVAGYPDSESALFYGPVGTGKTFILNAVAHGLLDKGVPVVYYTAYQLMDILSEDRFNRSEGLDPRKARIDRAPVLMIDDLGTEMVNTFTQSALFQLLNERIATGQPTLISSNLTPHDIQAQYTERIMSRLVQHFTLIPFFGPDVRYQR